MTSLQADEAFLEHFQLDHDPFAPRVPGFKFFPAQRKSVLGQLHHLARYSQLLLTVVGPTGSGKTLLRQALVASANKQTVQCVVLSGKDSASLLAQFAQGIGVRGTDLAAIQAQVVQLALTGQEVYLLVDDAEQLADDALETLLVIAAGSVEARPHVFLFGEPPVVPRLEFLSDGEERVHVIELQPYAEEETREYLALRLQGAGRDLGIFSEAQLTDIHEQSGGWPGLINEVARDALIDGMQADRRSGRGAGLGWRMPRKHLLAIAVVVVAVVAAWFMQGRSDEPAVVHTSELDLSGVGRPAESGPNEPLAADSGVPATGEQSMSRQPLAQAVGEEAELEAFSPAQAPVATPRPETSAQQPAVIEPQPVAPPQVAQQPTRNVAAPTASQPDVSQPVASQPATQTAVERSTAVPTPAPSAVETPAPASATGAAWYRAQPAENYVLQVLGTRSEQSAKALVTQYGAQYGYFSKIHQGKPLYVVTYGNFSSRSAAQAAVATLPAKLQAGKPWPKSFASIRKESGL